ncbi:AAA family ATPase [Sporosarcina sp. ACRSL]|uniref:uridine kinase family protein n=1 Tax=Sporosarcina sp. ACRSL TaxID=2918215 RepID=UPI001EF6AF71|nr:AAA family ATPase [Sporosarcina sp. ACRSL]MCG7345448.1 AAA family ATPase [Sporosarcina sp. ACRSL]
MDKIVREIANWINSTKKRIVIGISGHGAAGKTTFARKLLHVLDNVNYMNTDPYIVSSHVRKNTMIEYTYQNEVHHYKMTACHPTAHHLPSLERDVRMVRDGHNLYTINAHFAASELVSSDNRVTVVEGMCVAFIDPALFDLKIYLYTDDETELVRRLDRDVTERGTDINYLRQSHEERRIQYKLFMHQYSENFDVILNTSNGEILVEKCTIGVKNES